MTSDEIRAMQRSYIVDFLSTVGFDGRVLDFGCGTAPYREIVESNGAEWHGYNRGVYPGGATHDVGDDDPLEQKWDTILSTQSTQYYPDVGEMLVDFRYAAQRIVITYATNWPEVEVEDLWRFTRSGMERLLHETGWHVVDHRQLGAIEFGDRESLALGYGVVAR